MANLQFWNDVEDESLWQKLVGQDQENFVESVGQAARIFQGQFGLACLEVGAGVGRLLKRSNGHFAIAFGVDWSVEMVERSKKYLPAEGLPHIFLTDGERYPFSENFFDYVYSFTCFQHMEFLSTIRTNIREIYRVLRPGKPCLIQTVMGENGTGRHDGFVFPSGNDFAVEFMNAGFLVDGFTVEGEWIWLRAHKPLAQEKNVE